MQSYTEDDQEMFPVAVESFVAKHWVQWWESGGT